MYETLDLKVDGGAATLTMNRPEKLNAIDKKMMEEFREAFVRLDEREDVKVVVLRGAGRAFTAGADLTWSEEMTPKQRVEHNRIGQKTFDMMERMETPIFAADLLRAEDRVVGPAIIEAHATTIVVPPRFVAIVDRLGNYRLEQSQEYR